MEYSCQSARVIYSDRGSQFVAGSWRELWRVTGTKLAYSTSYHPQTQGVVERMNSVVSQTVRCRGGQIFPKSMKIRNSVASRAFFSIRFRAFQSVVADSVSE